MDQAYKKLEIILVDDGSPDNCPAMCDAWAEKDSRVRVIHKENGGVASARNVGLDNAAGQYISFVDSDDWIDSTMIAELVSCAAEYHTDVTECFIALFIQMAGRRICVLRMMYLISSIPHTAWNHFMDATKNSVKENKKALTGITLDGQEKYLWLFYFRFPHLYFKLLHFYYFLRKNLH